MTELRTCERCDTGYFGPPRFREGVGPIHLCWSCCIEVAELLGVDPAIWEDVIA